MDFSFASIAIDPELICLLIIPEYYSGNLVPLVHIVRLSTRHPSSSRRWFAELSLRYQPATNYVTYTIDTR